MKSVFSLGEMYVSDFIRDDDDYEGRKKYDLTMVIDESNGAARLTCQPPHDMMWGKYWYRSGINETMTRHLKEVVYDCKKMLKFDDGDVWLDIACNDGTLLNFVNDPSADPSNKNTNIITIGIDPADDTYFNESKEKADFVVQDYFSKQAYESVCDKKAKIVTTIAMFYDLDDPTQFISDVHDILEDDGIWVVQMSYTPLMIKQMAFDNICHEHVYYYSIENIKRLFESHGMKVFNCTLNDANGGSFRIYLHKDVCDVTKIANKQSRDIFEFNVKSILEHEKTLNLSDADTWNKFYEATENLKNKTVAFLERCRDENKIVCGYGASTKGNTLLQYFGIDNSLVHSIAERNPQKFGLKTIGTNIPITSEEEVRRVNPDYMIVLPWHFISEFVERESDYLDNGGKFIVPCPEFKIIGKNGVVLDE